MYVTLIYLSVPVVKIWAFGPAPKLVMEEITTGNWKHSSKWQLKQTQIFLCWI